MKKCPQCGRSYSDMVTVCPSCNVSLGGKPVRKPVYDASASKETAAEPRVAATPVQTQKQKKPNVVIMAIIFGLVAYCSAQFVSRGKPTPKNASEPATAAATTESFGSAQTGDITDPKEQFMIGRNYEESEQTMPEAVKWYRLSAEQGYADAQYALGQCYEWGDGIQQDYEEAVKWYRLAADQGHPFAQNQLGNCYYDGKGVEQDYTEAIKWYQLAIEGGLSLAETQYNLGDCYYYGNGVEQDYTEAVNWYRLAADQKYAHAQNDLGICYRNGYGVQQDYAEAVKWFRLAAGQGNAAAMWNLGYCYENGNGVPQDAEEAEKWYQAYEAAKGD